MLSSFDTGIRRTAALLAAVGLVALVVVPVAVGKPIPGPNGPSVQDIRTQGHNWAAKALLLKANGGLTTSVLPSAQDIQTLKRWRVQGHLLDANGALLRGALPSVQDIQTQGNNWAAKGQLLDVNGDLLRGKLPSALDIRTQGNNWAAKGQLLNASGGLLTASAESGNSGTAGFHWNEFGIGAGAMFALVLLLGVVAVGIHVVHTGSPREGRTA